MVAEKYDESTTFANKDFRATSASLRNSGASLGTAVQQTKQVAQESSDFVLE
jgi:hypothetical protein